VTCKIHRSSVSVRANVDVADWSICQIVSLSLLRFSESGDVIGSVSYNSRLTLSELTFLIKLCKLSMSTLEAMKAPVLAVWNDTSGTPLPFNCKPDGVETTAVDLKPLSIALALLAHGEVEQSFGESELSATTLNQGGLGLLTRTFHEELLAVLGLFDMAKDKQCSEDDGLIDYNSESIGTSLLGLSGLSSAESLFAINSKLTSSNVDSVISAQLANDVLAALKDDGLSDQLAQLVKEEIVPAIGEVSIVSLVPNEDLSVVAKETEATTEPPKPPKLKLIARAKNWCTQKGAACKARFLKRRNIVQQKVKDWWNAAPKAKAPSKVLLLNIAID
jgi:hypothetical protein